MSSSSKPGGSSRFSTLKVFQFGSKSKSPPAPPPKDDAYANYYRNGPASASSTQLPIAASYASSSLGYAGQGGSGYASAAGSYVSLSQTLNSTGSPTNDAPAYTASASSSSSHYQNPPQTPRTPLDSAAPSSFYDPRAPSPAPSGRKASAGSTSAGLTPDGRSGRGFKLPGFGRKMSKGPISPGADSPSTSFPTPPIPPPDDNISMPWNFQHNMHIDESMNGLPPSWVEELTRRGYTEEDIMALKAARARPVPTSPIPQPPQPSPNSAGSAGPPALLPAHLAPPRSSSLHRAPSSQSIASQRQQQQPQPQASQHSRPGGLPSNPRKMSDASSTHSFAPSNTSGSHGPAANQYVNNNQGRSGSSLSQRTDPPSATSTSFHSASQQSRSGGNEPTSAAASSFVNLADSEDGHSLHSARSMQSLHSARSEVSAHSRRTEDDESWDFATPQRPRVLASSTPAQAQAQGSTPDSPPPIYRLDDAPRGGFGDEKARYQPSQSAQPTVQNGGEDEDTFDEEDDDDRRNTMVPLGRRDTVATVKDKRDTLVPSNRDTLVPGGRRDTLRPGGSQRDTIMPGQKPALTLALASPMEDSDDDEEDDLKRQPPSPTAQSTRSRAPSAASGSVKASSVTSPADTEFMSPVSQFSRTSQARSPSPTQGQPRGQTQPARSQAPNGTPSPSRSIPPTPSPGPVRRRTPSTNYEDEGTYEDESTMSAMEFPAPPPMLPELDLSNRNTKRRSKRFSTAAPRLSLDTGALGDLSSWSASLFSGLSSAVDGDGDVLSKQQAIASAKVSPAGGAGGGLSGGLLGLGSFGLGKSTFGSSPSPAPTTAGSNGSAAPILPPIRETVGSGNNSPRPVRTAASKTSPQPAAAAAVISSSPIPPPAAPTPPAVVGLPSNPRKPTQTQNSIAKAATSPVVPAPQAGPQTLSRSPSQALSRSPSARKAVPAAISVPPSVPTPQAPAPSASVAPRKDVAAADRAAVFLLRSKPSLNGLPGSPKPPAVVPGLPSRPVPKTAPPAPPVEADAANTGPLHSTSQAQTQAPALTVMINDTPQTTSTPRSPISPLEAPQPLVVKNRKKKPAPLSNLPSPSSQTTSPASDDGDLSVALPSAGTPLWNELLTLTSPAPSSVDSGSDPSAAGSSGPPTARTMAMEANSPVLPRRMSLDPRGANRVSLAPPKLSLGPGAGLIASPPRVRPTSLSREDDASEMGLLSPDFIANSRRDSDISDTGLLSPDIDGSRRNSDMTVRSDRDSGVTVSAEIVRDAVTVTYQRAVANVVPRVSPSLTGMAQALEGDEQEGTSTTDLADAPSPVPSKAGRVAAAVQAIDRLAPPASPAQSQSSSTVTTPTGADGQRPPSPSGSVASSSSRSASPSNGWSSSSSHRPAFTTITAGSSVEGQPSPKSPNGLAYLDGSGSAQPSPQPSPTVAAFNTANSSSPSSGGLDFQPSPISQPSPFPSAWRSEFGPDKLKPLPQYDQHEYDASAALGQRILLDEVGDEDDELGQDEAEDEDANTTQRAIRPRIVVSDISRPAGVGPNDPPASTTTTTAPQSAVSLTPDAFRGWVMDILAPLEEFLDSETDPRERYTELTEIAEGDSGSVFAARASPESASSATTKRKRPSRQDTSPSAHSTLVAIKIIPVDPAGSPKIAQLRAELERMREVRHANVLTMDKLFVDLAEDALWIRMELMERSLADVIALADEGAEMTEPIMARFAADALSALEFLQAVQIAHRDVRSDNMLINGAGVLKLADFSNAIRVELANPPRTDIVGVVYWQAPEVRRGPYNPLKVDVFSLGATVWEMAQHEPPFSDVQDASGLDDQWLPLEDYSENLQDFLRLCSMPATPRPDPDELLSTSFIRTAAPRTDIVRLLATCRSLEGADGA